MRFRARIEHDKFGRFYEIVKCLSESGGKHAVVHLAEDQCRFVVTTEEESLVLFISVASAGTTFSELRIESRSNNTISLEVGIPNLVHALKAGASSHFVTLKLTKKGASPYLTVDAQVRGMMRVPWPLPLFAFVPPFQVAEGACNVVQDVPVRVLNAAEAARYQDPKVPEPMVGCGHRRCGLRWGAHEPHRWLRRPASVFRLLERCSPSLIACARLAPRLSAAMPMRARASSSFLLRATVWRSRRRSVARL